MKQLPLFHAAVVVVGLPVISSAGEFEDRCADPNVIRSYDLENHVDMTTGNPERAVLHESAWHTEDPAGNIGKCTLHGGTACWGLDRAMKVSGEPWPPAVLRAEPETRAIRPTCERM
jgi:hypothetical protein